MTTHQPALTEADPLPGPKVDWKSRRADRPARREFDEFVSASADPLLRSAYLITWDLSEAEDLVQECLTRMARVWPRLRRMEHPYAYARRVLVNLALDAGPRRSRRRVELDAGSTSLEVLPDHRVDISLARVELVTDLQRALGELTPRQRATLALRYFEDLPETEVARLLGCGVGTVKSTTSRALERLRTVVDKRDFDGPFDQIDHSGTAVSHAVEGSTTK